MAATFLITDATSLKRVLWLGRGSRVLISWPHLAQMDRRRLQERMNRLLGESGFGLGLAALVAGLAWSILWAGGNWEFSVAHWLPTIGLCAAACLFAGGLGRTIGFLSARWRLARLIWSTLSAGNTLSEAANGIAGQRARLLSQKRLAQ